MGFATQYRPKSLDEVIGNESIKKVLDEMVSTKRFHHVMFEGLKGCGKTSLAYILADLFGADPQNIDKVNCVYFSGVDMMRSKLESLPKTSFFGNKKVLILDEIHGLSKPAQQVFLTPLEELDNSSLVIACTTTIENVNPMLLERFTRLKVKPLNDNDAITLVKRIAKREGLVLPKWKLALLIEKCDGIPRRLLSGLDTVKSIDDEKEVTFLLDLNELSDEDPDILELFKYILSKAGWDVIKNKLKKLLKEKNPEEIRIGLANITSARLMSDYGSIDEKISLSKLYSNYLRIPISYPEKANLINLVFQLSVRG